MRLHARLRDSRRGPVWLRACGPRTYRFDEVRDEQLQAGDRIVAIRQVCRRSVGDVDERGGEFVTGGKSQLIHAVELEPWRLHCGDTRA